MCNSKSSTFPPGYPAWGWHLTSIAIPNAPGRSASLRLPMSTFARPSTLVLLQVWSVGICGCTAKTELSPPEMNIMTPALRQAKAPLNNLEPATMLWSRGAVWVSFTIHPPSNEAKPSKALPLCWQAKPIRFVLCGNMSRRNDEEGAAVVSRRSRKRTSPPTGGKPMGGRRGSLAGMASQEYPRVIRLPMG